MASTFEDAKLCPRCNNPGEDRNQTPDQNGGKTHFIYCMTNTCEWYDTPWSVTVRRDGTVPDPADFYKKPKLYQGFEHDNVAAQRIINALTKEYDESIKSDPKFRR